MNDSYYRFHVKVFINLITRGSQSQQYVRKHVFTPVIWFSNVSMKCEGHYCSMTMISDSPSVTSSMLSLKISVAYMNLLVKVGITQWAELYTHKADVPPIYLLMKHSHSSGSKYFSRFLYMMFALV